MVEIGKMIDIFKQNIEHLKALGQGAKYLVTSDYDELLKQASSVLGIRFWYFPYLINI